jgi:murein DD-endopeptidase MepM/ murein hydrolase activator NlpD
LKLRPARAATYLVVALLVVAALRFTPELPDHPAAEVLQQGDAPVAAPRLHSRTERLNRGETLIGLLKRAGVTDQAAAEVVRAASASAVDARYLKAGMPVEFTADSAGAEPSELVFHLGVDRLLKMRRIGSSWSGTEERLPWTTDTVAVGGTIHANLYQAMESSAAQYFPAHAKDELAWALADIFEYRVDMSRDLQEGDQFKALVERQVGPGGVTRVGKVLAATFSLSGSDIAAVRFESRTASAQYYDATGKSMRAQFLRAPLEFRRISSTFGNRFHPILGQWKNHKGTDYAASSGTPVRAIGDAVVLRAGWAGGYGNMLELRHRNGYVTRYAASPWGCAPARGSTSRRRSATSAPRGAARARTCTSRSWSAGCRRIRAWRSSPSPASRSPSRSAAPSICAAISSSRRSTARLASSASRRVDALRVSGT